MSSVNVYTQKVQHKVHAETKERENANEGGRRKEVEKIVKKLKRLKRTKRE